MELEGGDAHAAGNMAYVPQTAWCQNMSLKDNIVFGQPFDQERYNRVIHACALELDLQILPAGDQSKAGLRGINLSGGQRQRLNLARCAYFGGDLVLLDNALSAVDHHTAQQIFEHCVKNMFRDKATVLVGLGRPLWLPVPPACLPGVRTAQLARRHFSPPPARLTTTSPAGHPPGRLPAPVRQGGHHGRRHLRLLWPLVRRRRHAAVQVPARLAPAGRRRRRRAAARHQAQEGRPQGRREEGPGASCRRLST
jgi:hypothetical protein